MVQRKVRDKFNQACCWAIRSTQTIPPVAGDCGVVMLFHDYEGEYARAGVAEVSRRGVSSILDIERKYGVKATFNTVGKLMLDVPDIIERIISEGHELASHSYDHTILAGMNAPALVADLHATRDTIESFGGTLRGIRSPQSRWSFLQMRVMLQEGLQWSAENHKHTQPFFLPGGGGRALLRLPVIFDDWQYESHGLSPDDMYARLVEHADLIADRRGYGGLGFHPWVQAEQPGRIEVFERFVDYIAQHNRLRTLTFHEASCLFRESVVRPAGERMTAGE